MYGRKILILAFKFQRVVSPLGRGSLAARGGHGSDGSTHKGQVQQEGAGKMAPTRSCELPSPTKQKVLDVLESQIAHPH